DLKPDAEKALHNYTMAVELGGSVEAALGYARIKYLGKTGVQDIPEALRVYEKMAEFDNRIGHYMCAKIVLDQSPSPEQVVFARHHAKAALTLGLLRAKELLATAAAKEGRLLPALRWSLSALLDRLRSRGTADRTI
ncbi:SEL1-like repeat protein, partial [Novilysobacter erysipheiresistens]